LDSNWIGVVRKKAMTDLKAYFNFKNTDNVVFWMFFYSKCCYVLSNEKDQECDKYIIKMSFLLLIFSGVQWVILKDFFGDLLSEIIYSISIISIFFFYVWRILTVIQSGEKFIISEYPSKIYPMFIAKHSPKDKLSDLVFRTFFVFFACSVSSVFIFFSGHYAIALICFSITSFFWSGWFLLYKANNSIG
jgi:hypothetical protein